VISLHQRVKRRSTIGGDESTCADRVRVTSRKGGIRCLCEFERLTSGDIRGTGERAFLEADGHAAFVQE
jgi:hypothetical protein